MDMAMWSSHTWPTSSPSSRSVLLDLAQLLDIPPAACQGINDQTLSAASVHFAAIAASLKQVMTDKWVRFVNASFGSTVPNLANDWAPVCGGTAPSTEH